jgi:prolyl oligopeptidase
VKAWIAEQNRLTRKYLDAIPQRAEIKRRVERLRLEQTVYRYDFQYRSGLFALKTLPPANQPCLVVLPRDGDTAKERVVLDPGKLDPRGRTTIDFYKASYDGKHVVVSLSEDGSEDGTAYVYEVATGRRLPDVLPGVTYPTAGGSAEWAADSKGFYYTRYPRSGERPEADRHFYQQVYFHRLGTPVAMDRYVIGRELPRIAEIALDGGRDGKYLLADVRNGDGGEVAFHLRDPAGRWTGRWVRRRGEADGDRRIRPPSCDDDQGRAARADHLDAAREAAARVGARRYSGSVDRRRRSRADALAALRQVSRRRPVDRTHLHARRQAAGCRADGTGVRDRHRHSARRR